MIARIKCQTCAIVGQLFKAPVFVVVKIKHANVFSELNSRKKVQQWIFVYNQLIFGDSIDLFKTHRLLMAIKALDRLLKPVKMNGTRFLCSSNVHSVSCTDKKSLFTNVLIWIRINYATHVIQSNSINHKLTQFLDDPIWIWTETFQWIFYHFPCLIWWLFTVLIHCRNKNMCKNTNPRLILIQ